MKSVGYCFKCREWLAPERARKSGFGKSWFCLLHGTTLRVSSKDLRDVEAFTGETLPKRPE